MKRLYDLSPVQQKNNNGGGEYCKRIFYQLIYEDKSNKFDFLVLGNRKVPHEIEKLVEEYNLVIKKVYSKKEINQIVNEYNLFYSALPYTYYYLKLNDSTKFVYTIHGLRDIEMPYDTYYLTYENYNIKAMFKTCLHKIFPQYLQNRAKSNIKKLLELTHNRQIFVVSNHTKYSLLANFSNISSEEIEVLYSPEKIYEGNLPLIEVDLQYILLVSGDRWLKNNIRMAIAIDELISEKKVNYKVIVTGVRNDNVYKRHLKNTDRFIFLNYVATNELEWLYKNAELFAFPSLNEGFGYPPLEAMKYSTVCICAADTSIPEVCGSAVLYFNPYDIMEMKTRILSAMDVGIRNELIDAMSKQIKKISRMQKESLQEIVRFISE